MVTNLPLAVKSIIQLGRDTHTNWSKENPILQEGETIMVTMSDGSRGMKIGDGVKRYSALPWRHPRVEDSLGTSDIISASQRAITEGIERIESIIDIFKYQERI